jgi:hypothetical protein
MEIDRMGTTPVFDVEDRILRRIGVRAARWRQPPRHAKLAAATAAPLPAKRRKTMNKRFWMAFAACYVVGQVLSFLINGVLLQDTYKSLASVWRPEAEMQAKMWIFFVTSFVAIFLFCYIFTKGYENKGVVEGVRYGVLVGLLLTVPMAYDSYVIYPIPYSLALTWFLTGMVFWVVLGALLAAIYRPDGAKS